MAHPEGYRALSAILPSFSKFLIFWGKIYDKLQLTWLDPFVIPFVIKIYNSSATDLNPPGWDFQTGMSLLNLPAAMTLAQTTTPEVYAPTPLYAPETWSGEGEVAPMERAASSWASVISELPQFLALWSQSALMRASRLHRL